MEVEERASKRRKLASTSSPPDNVVPGYLTLAMAEFDIEPRTNSAAIELRGSDLLRVNIRASFGTYLQLTSTSQKGTFEYIHGDVPTKSEQLLLEACSKIESIAKYDQRQNFELFPLGCHYATIRSTSTSGPSKSCTLRVSIIWKDDTVARDKVRPEHWAIWNNYFPVRSVMQTPKEEYWDPRQFYENVHVPDRKSEDAALSIDLLTCKLFPFQERAVHWLLHREGVAVDPRGQIREQNLETDILPAGFHHAADLNGVSMVVNHALGVASTDLDAVRMQYQRLKGGILAEEMGLGKTVELIALMCLHRRKEYASIIDSPSSDNLIASPATLIITPPTILQQWIQELKQHAPALKVYHYEGLTTESRRVIDDDQSRSAADRIARRLADNDVVVTTYNVISKEVHYVEDLPDRNLRRKNPIYERPKSPLTQISWWRVCLDEAQKVETGVSNAAVVACRIPRINAWAVTGTPLKKEHKDLFGLLVFLKYEPWCVSLKLWTRLLHFHRPLFEALMGEIAIRHSKEYVRDDLRLPPQTRHTITVPFTAIEEQYYGQMFNQMCEEIGLDGNGAPLEDEWDPSSPKMTESMRQWLTRLRQICLHPEVGGRNRRALGRNGGPLRTVLQVLDVMIDQNDGDVRAEQRALLLLQTRRGQLWENSKDTKIAMEIWQAANEEAGTVVDECRAEYEIVRKEWVQKKKTDEMEESEEENDAEERNGDTRLLTCRQRLRSALEVKHICIFFIANGFFQLKSNEETVKPGSDDYKKLEKQEEEAYEEAKVIRRELLSEALNKANRLMDNVKKGALEGLVQLPAMDLDFDYSGIESRKIFDKLDRFCEAMNSQAEQYRKLRQKMIDFLSESLIDAEQGVELQGDEYESSTKLQDEMYVYMEILRALFADRHDAITGQENILIKHEMKMLQRAAKEGQGSAPDLLIKLLAERDLHRVPSELGSLRGIVSEIRQLVTALQWQEGGGSARARAELGITETLLQRCQKLIGVQSKSVSSLEQEVGRIRDTMNYRLEYYRALQKISDTVAPIEEENVGKPVSHNRIQNMLIEEDRKSFKLSSLLAKKRYLQHLKAESSSESTARICIICQSDFEMGTLTVCGHQFCKECIQLWYAAHKTCPVCKKHLRGADFWDVTYKPQELVIQEEAGPTPLGSPGSASGPNQAGERSVEKSIYSDVSANTLNEIKRIDLSGASFGSKIDTICRHILWLRNHDPGSKAIIFSQYREFLEVLGRAFKQTQISWTRFDEKNGIEKFKNDPAVECFLLDAKAQSAGLNLVVANHVFLCEPLINTAIELQAIARVHRIGQQRSTVVWMYLVADTVEETIYEISVDRRLEHMKGKGSSSSLSTKHQQIQFQTSSKSGTATPASMLENQIEAANTLELQAVDLSKLLSTGKSGGELVREQDLWQCLFRRPRAKETGLAMQAVGAGGAVADGEADRFFRRKAAEDRRGGGDGGGGGAGAGELPMR